MRNGDSEDCGGGTGDAFLPELPALIYGFAEFFGSFSPRIETGYGAKFDKLLKMNGGGNGLQIAHK